MLPFRRRIGDMPRTSNAGGGARMARASTSSNLPGLFDTENVQPQRKYNLRHPEPAPRDDTLPRHKRKSAQSPTQGPGMKRSAFSDVTNAIQRLHLPGSSRNKAAEGVKERSTQGRYKALRINVARQQPPVIREEGSTVFEDVQNGTLYMSALEDLTEVKAQSQPECPVVPVAVPTRASSAPPVSFKESAELFLSASERSLICRDLLPHIPTPGTPPRGVLDYDKETARDTFSAPVYAPYIFSYLKTRENLYQVKPNFLDQHEEINNDIRAIVVDWMIEVQETLELNHETLYLGVKNMDLFLSEPKNRDKKKSIPSFPVKRDRLRLVACASLLLAAQYDERLPPPLHDWLEVSSHDFTSTELSRMQQKLFCALDFNLGAPLSYRFLRRYARACSIDMDLLTLARYILEASLLHSQFSSESDSLLASAALWLASCMTKKANEKSAQVLLWTQALQHYSGYKVGEIHGVAARLNEWMKQLPSKSHIQNVCSKYSHKVFRQVALIPPLNQL